MVQSALDCIAIKEKSVPLNHLVVQQNINLPSKLHKGKVQGTVSHQETLHQPSKVQLPLQITHQKTLYHNERKLYPVINEQGTQQQTSQLPKRALLQQYKNTKATGQLKKGDYNHHHPNTLH